MKNKEDYVEGFALSGDMLKGIKDKHFEIIQKPRYELLPDLDDPKLKRKKMIVLIKLADDTECDYYPNKTSQRTIISKRGMMLRKWVGFKGEFELRTQLVRGTNRNVIYIKDNGK